MQDHVQTYHEAAPILIANKDRLMHIMNSIKEKPICVAVRSDKDIFTGKDLGTSVFYCLDGLDHEKMDNIQWSFSDKYHFEKYNIIFNDSQYFEQFLCSQI